MYTVANRRWFKINAVKQQPCAFAGNEPVVGHNNKLRL